LEDFLEDFMEDLEASLGLEKSAAREHELSGATSNLSPVETYADSVQIGKNIIARPTSNNYFGVEPGSGLFFQNNVLFFSIMLMLTSASKNHSKIIYGPVTS
jgi:hypothetical protein